MIIDALPRPALANLLAFYEKPYLVATTNPSTSVQTAPGEVITFELKGDPRVRYVEADPKTGKPKAAAEPKGWMKRKARPWLTVECFNAGGRPAAQVRLTSEGARMLYQLRSLEGGEMYAKR